MERLAFPIVRYLSLVYTIVIVWCTKPLLYPAFRLQVWNISSVPDLFCNITFVHTLVMSLVCHIRAGARFSLEKLGKILPFGQKDWRIYAPTQRSIFAFCARADCYVKKTKQCKTNILITFSPFPPLREAKCESSSHTHQTCVV